MGQRTLFTRQCAPMSVFRLSSFQTSMQWLVIAKALMPSSANSVSK